MISYPFVIPSLLWFLKMGTMLANIFCFLGIFYGRQIYDKEDINPQKVHFLSLGLAGTFIFYLASLFVFFIYLLWTGHFAFSLLFLAFLVSPFLIGFFGNDFDKAKNYFNIQLLLLVLSFVVLLFFYLLNSKN